MPRELSSRLLRDGEFQPVKNVSVIHVDGTGIYTFANVVILQHPHEDPDVDEKMYFYRGGYSRIHMATIPSDDGLKLVVSTSTAIWSVTSDPPSSVRMLSAHFEHKCEFERGQVMGFIYHPVRKSYIITDFHSPAVEVNSDFEPIYQLKTVVKRPSGVVPSNHSTLIYTIESSAADKQVTMNAADNRVSITGLYSSLLMRPDHPETVVMINGQSLTLFDAFRSSSDGLTTFKLKDQKSKFTSDVHIDSNICVTNYEDFIRIVDYRVGLVYTMKSKRPGITNMWYVSDLRKLYVNYRASRNLSIIDI